MHTEPMPAQGFLWIGDPHVTSRRPGRRRDVDFTAVVLDKIEQALAIANARELVPVFLGDLFDRHDERDLRLLTRLMRVLKTAWTPPLELLGNHERDGLGLDDGDSLMLLAEAGCLRVITDNGLVGRFRIDDEIICLGATPHGQEIPADVREITGGDRCFWLTHHDIAFPGSYPGALTPFAIQGCEEVINGHMHAPQDDILVGDTRWTNPGNITRLSIDVAEQVPCVWSRGKTARQRHTLRYTKDVFDFTGRQVDAAPLSESVFANLLQADMATDAARSQDGGLLREDLTRVLEEQAVDPLIAAMIWDLHAQAVAKLDGVAP